MIKKNKQKLLLSLLVLPFITASGQSTGDTVRIREVVVNGSPVTSVLTGYKAASIDTVTIKNHSLGTVSDIMAESSPLFIKNYGPSGSATLSFRGSAASHTQLMWNDLSINSPMLGQMDLSLIPGGFVDNIRIFSGGASMAAGSGGLGGLISLENKPDWENRNALQVTAGAGSFGHFSGLINARKGNEKFQSVTRIFGASARNDFDFFKPQLSGEPEKLTMSNADILQGSLIQDLYFRSSRSVTSASAWLSWSDRNIPPNILYGGPLSTENQKDNSVRTVIRHKRYLRRGGSESTIAWFNEYMKYLNESYSINSVNRSNSLLLKQVLDIPAGSDLTFKFMASNELTFVNSVNYAEKKKRNLFVLSASARRTFADRIGAVILVREQVDGSDLTIPDVSAALDYELRKNSGSYIKINVARNSKVPTLNDLYWNPDGNPDLKSENSMSAEVTADIEKQLNERNELKTSISFFKSWINDQIRWLPTSSWTWSPVNIAKSENSGIEAGITYNYKFSKARLSANVFYSYTKASEVSDTINSGKQQVYVPLNMFNGNLRLSTGSFTSYITGSFTGKRYTLADNSKSLPSFFTMNLGSTYTLKAYGCYFDLGLRIDNLLNESYQIIEGYPVPGRSLLFSISFRLP